MAFKFKERTPELLMSQQEFSDTWIAMIEHYYKAGISDDRIYKPLAADQAAADKLAIGLGTVLMIVAMRDWDASKTAERYRTPVEQEVVRGAFRQLYGFADARLDDSVAYYRQQYEMLRQLAPTGRDLKAQADQKAADDKRLKAQRRAQQAADRKAGKQTPDVKPSKPKLTDEYSDAKTEEKIKAQMVGFACFTIEQATGEKAGGYESAVEALSLLLVQADVAFSRLMAHSVLDGNSLILGKPRYIVGK